MDWMTGGKEVRVHNLNLGWDVEMELVGKGFGKKAKVESPRLGNQLNVRVEEGQKSRQDPKFPFLMTA